MLSKYLHHGKRLYSEHDKRQHFGVSLMLVLLLPVLLPSLWSAVGATLLIGLIKEVWDHCYGSGFCWFDMVANCAGIITGVGLILYLPLAAEVF